MEILLYRLQFLLSLIVGNRKSMNCIDSLQTTFFSYLRDHLDDTESLDAAVIHTYVRDRLSQLPGWDETQRAYFMELLSVRNCHDFDM